MSEEQGKRKTEAQWAVKGKMGNISTGSEGGGYLQKGQTGRRMRQES